MNLPNFFSRGVLIAAVSFAAACDDSDPLDPDPEPDIHQVIVQVEGGMQVTFNRARIVSGKLTIRGGDVVTFSFLGADGEEEENANDTERFDLLVSYPNGNPSGLVWTPSPTDEYSGTFTRTSPSTASIIVRFELKHTSEKPEHPLHGPWNVLVDVL